jgi:hypothetical protein
MATHPRHSGISSQGSPVPLIVTTSLPSILSRSTCAVPLLTAITSVRKQEHAEVFLRHWQRDCQSAAFKLTTTMLFWLRVIGLLQIVTPLNYAITIPATQTSSNLTFFNPSDRNGSFFASFDPNDQGPGEPLNASIISGHYLLKH